MTQSGNQYYMTTHQIYQCFLFTVCFFLSLIYIVVHDDTTEDLS